MKNSTAKDIDNSPTMTMAQAAAFAKKAVADFELHRGKIEQLLEGALFKPGAPKLTMSEAMDVARKNHIYLFVCEEAKRRGLDPWGMAFGGRTICKDACDWFDGRARS